MNPNIIRQVLDYQPDFFNKEDEFITTDCYVFQESTPNKIHHLVENSIKEFRDLYEIIQTNTVTVMHFPPDCVLRDTMVMILDENGLLRTSPKVNTISRLIKSPVFGTVIVVPMEIWSGLPY